ncbi:hypothetical protein [Teredinibacter purpureus]|uniref:hypothetical protein n=1 Tax=Teredinibacter purpureus TaxID=2731756 RepID=UPI0005F8099E|nr:hypothetical protein [Teredinibacter purpureus]
MKLKKLLTSLSLLLSALVISIATPLAVAQQQVFYIGTFQSNEAMTLASMEAMDGIPEKEKVHYRKKFFGKLVNEFRFDSFTTYFANLPPEAKDFVPADIRRISDNAVRIKYFHEQRGEVVRELTFVDGCYSIPVTIWQFKEYFCKIH